MSKTCLHALSVSVNFDRYRALDGASLDVESGNVTAVIGPNGSGKTTLLRALAGLLPQATGAITLNGEDPRYLSPQVAARTRSYCPQQPKSAWDYRVSDLGEILGLPDAFHEWLEALALTELTERRLSELSGGEQKATHLALCFATVREPFGHTLLLDEPTASLDFGRQTAVHRAIRAQAQAGAACLVASHDMGFVAQCDQVIVLSEGRWVAGGTPADTLTPQIIREVWGVDGVLLPPV